MQRISLSSLLLNIWEPTPSVVGEVCSESSHLPGCRIIDSIQSPGCLLTKLKAIISHEDAIRVYCNKMVLPQAHLCADQPLVTCGEGQEGLSLHKIPLSIKEVVGVELMWCLPLCLIQQH